MKTKMNFAAALLVIGLAGNQTVLSGPQLALSSNAVITLTATNDLSSTLQRGLFEEEGNRDLTAAVSAYQALAAQFDQNRPIAATAIFRLGECYRKLGKTNEAVAQYERIVNQFSDQQTLTTLSRQNLAGLGSQTVSAVATSKAARQEQEKLLEKQIKLAEQDQADAERRFELGHGSQAEVRASESSVLRLRLQLAALDGSKVDLLDLGTVTPTEEDQEIRRIQTMIQNSPDLINSTADGGLTPISKAAQAGWLRVVTFLLDHGATLDRSALLYATGSGNKAMVELLIARGADLNAQDNAGNSALHRAAENGYLSVAQVLIQHGAKLEARNSKQNAEQTPLHRAATQGNPAMINLLATKGADLNARDALGNTALSRAAFSGHVAACEQLLKAGARTDIEDNEGRTPLFYAARGGNFDFINALLAAKADPNAGRNGSTLFATSNPDVLKLLLAAGANPNVKDENGRTPLLAVIGKSPVDSAALLIQHGADVNITDDSTGLTPLQMAVWAQSIPTISLLLSNKADINAQHRSGRTALAMSKEAESGYRPSRPGDYGGSSSSPDRLAAAKISALLREHGALDDLPKWDRIEVRRAAGSYSEVVFLKETNDWNRFSLFEALATIYRMTADVGDRAMIGLPGRLGRAEWSFPDLAHVKIRRATPEGKTWKEIPVDLDAISKSEDCARDLPLEWGDVLEIPEKDHLVTDTPQELPPPTRELLARCLKRTVTVRIGGVNKAVELSPNPTGSGFPAQFSVRQALEISGLLRSSSDTGRVKITRSNSTTGKTSIWVVDARNPSNFFPASGDPNAKLWLRDGDLIEVPDKP